MGAVKRNKTDILFSKCIRERSNWTCEKCGTYYPEGKRQGLHCSHFFGRSRQGLRWHPLNAAAHCYGCHRYLGSNPDTFKDWQMRYLGHTDYERLQIMARHPTKLLPYEKELIHKHLLSEHKRMLELRLAGVTGRIDFTHLPEASTV